MPRTGMTSRGRHGWDRRDKEWHVTDRRTWRDTDGIGRALNGESGSGELRQTRFD